MVVRTPASMAATPVHSMPDVHKGKTMVSASYPDESGPGQWLFEVSLAVGTKIWVTLEIIFF